MSYSRKEGPMSIDLSNRMNPARYPAERQAFERARREQQPMCIYVGPPETPHAFVNDGKYNVWFVRRHDEARPQGAELFAIVTPEMTKGVEI